MQTLAATKVANIPYKQSFKFNVPVPHRAISSPWPKTNMHIVVKNRNIYLVLYENSHHIFILAAVKYD